MKILKNMLIVLVLLVLGGCSIQKNLYSDALVIRNVTTIDAKNGLQENRTVVVKDHKIIDNIPTAAVKTSSSQIVDGTGKFLIPGLWDAHVHLSFEQDLTPAMFDLFLAYGITSIRDTGGQLDLVLPEREKARKNPNSTPRVMIAGPLLDGVPTVYDGSSPGRPKLGLGAGSVKEAEALVNQFATAQVDLIKAYEMLSPAAFKAVLKLAKSKGLKVTGHVPLSMDVVEASQAGMNSMEHMRNLEMACSKDWESLLDQRQNLLKNGADKEGGTLRSNIHSAQRTHAVENQDAARRNYVLKELAQNGTWQIPTLSIMTTSALRPFATDEWKNTFQFLPPSVADRWSSNLANYLATPIKESQQAYTKWALDMITHLKEANVPIMAGTDCPIFFLTPGYSLHEELALLVKGGLTPMEALEAATLRPAQYFNMEKELGVIEKGMLADLVLLNANPLDNIKNTSTIEAVVRNGQFHDREALNGMLRKRGKK